MDSEKPRARRRVRTAASFAAVGWAMTMRGGKSVGEAVVAVDAGDLFDEVDLALEVETPGGELDGEGFGGLIGLSLQPSAVRYWWTISGGEAFGSEGGAEVALDLLDGERMGGRFAVRAAISGMRTSMSAPSAWPPRLRG